MLTHTDLHNLNLDLDVLQDNRPQWLKDMPSASDPTALYYRFFHELVSRHGPLNVCEIGTYVGSSAAHLAYANHGGHVLTIDMNPDAKKHADALGLPNLTALVSDSMVAATLQEVKERAPFDLLFIDGLHNFNQTYGEYHAFRPLVRDGGIIFFDDLALDMATREMHAFWAMVPDPKDRFDGLHYTGFGAAMKDPGVIVPAWSEIIHRARQTMREMGATQLP